MKISEVIRPKIRQVAFIKDDYDYYCVHIFGNEFLANYLIWSGEKSNRMIIRKSHKQGRFRIKDLELSDTKLRCVIGTFRYGINRHLLSLDNSDPNCWRLEYNPEVSPSDLGEIIDILCRVRKIRCPEFLIPEENININIKS